MRHLLAALILILAGPARADDLLSAAVWEKVLSADIVILGEVHDNAAHHAGQGAVLARLEPSAIVFEMLSPEMAAQVENASGEDVEALGKKIGWTEAGWPDITLYAPVFEALGAAAIVGAALPRARVRSAFAAGAATVFGSGAARFGLDRPLPDAEQAAREAMQFDAHCQAMPRALMGGMVEAQRLRDAAFSAATLEAYETYGAPVAVIAGHGHARRDWGMPALLALAAPDLRVFSLGFVEAPGQENDPRFDATVVTDPAPRGDPCAAFGN